MTSVEKMTIYTSVEKVWWVEKVQDGLFLEIRKLQLRAQKEAKRVMSTREGE